MKKVIRKNGNLIFNVNGKDVYPAAYMSYCPKDADYKGFAEMGYKLYSYAIYASDAPTNEFSGLLKSWEKGCWAGEGEYDFSALDNGMRLIYEASASNDFYIILRINVNVPYWWREKYPEELITYKNGNKVMQSSASMQWRKDVCVFLDALKEHIESSSYADNIIAWQIAAMSTEEWIHPREQFYELAEDLPWRDYYRSFCKAKYSSISELNAAYNTDLEGFEQLELPSCEEMAEKRDFGKKAKAYIKVRDAYEALNDSYADTITFFSRYVKKIFDGDIFCGAFYGYVGEFYDTMAHCATDRLFNEESIDFFAAPFAYVNGRAMGIDWVYRCPVHTADNCGKLFFMEADVRTHLTRHLHDTRPDMLDRSLPYFNLPVFFGPDTERQSMNNILRIFSKIFISQHPFWWFDMWGGWYKSENYMKLHKRLFDIYNEKVKRTVKSNTEIALILDENSAYETANDIQYKSVFEQIIELSFVGATFDLLLIDEINDSDIDKYKLFFFTNPVTFSEKYKTLKEKILQSGKNILVSGESEDSSGVIIDRKELPSKVSDAGVFLYCEGNTVYQNDEFLAVTATGDSGAITLKIPNGRRLKNMITQEVLEPQNGEVVLKAGFNDSFLFEMIER